MPQGKTSFKKKAPKAKKAIRGSKVHRTKKGKVHKPPRKLRAKQALAADVTVGKMITQRTEREAKAMVMREGSKLKILDMPPVLAPKGKKQT